MEYNEEYWEDRMNNAETREEFSSALSGCLSAMVDAGELSMGWCEDKEEMIFFMTPDQKKAHDMGHA